MVIFIYGEDTYRARQKLNEIVEHYKEIHKSGLNLRFLDVQTQEFSLNELKDGLRQSSIFKEKKLLIISDVFSSKKLTEELAEQMKEIQDSDDIIIFFQQGAVEKKNVLFESLKKIAKCQEFSPLTGQKLRNWVAKEFEKHKAKIESQALDKLLEYAGNDLWRMNNEIIKLVNFKKNKEVEAKDIALLVKPGIETDIFKTIDAIGQKDKKQAIKLLQKHLEKGDSPLYLLSMINYQFRNLLIVKDLIERRNTFSNIARKSGLHPFVAKKSYFLAQKFSFPELKKIYQRIFQVDLDIKTGKIEPEAALEILAAGV